MPVEVGWEQRNSELFLERYIEVYVLYYLLSLLLSSSSFRDVGEIDRTVLALTCSR